MAKKDPLTNIRRDHFREYCEKQGWKNSNGSWATNEIAYAFSKSVQQVSNLLNKSGSFGPVMARDLEKNRKLPHGFFDGPTDIDFVDVPRINVAVSAGHGSTPHVEDTIGHLKFTREFLRSCGVNPLSARVVNVDGESMEPTIKDGAVLLISTNNKEPVQNQIFAMVRLSEGLVVKRLVRISNQWIARSDNRDYPDIPINDGEPITIIGRAIWMGAKL